MQRNVHDAVKNSIADLIDLLFQYFVPKAHQSLSDVFFNSYFTFHAENGTYSFSFPQGFDLRRRFEPKVEFWKNLQDQLTELSTKKTNPSLTLVKESSWQKFMGIWIVKANSAEACIQFFETYLKEIQQNKSEDWSRLINALKQNLKIRSMRQPDPKPIVAMIGKARFWCQTEEEKVKLKPEPEQRFMVNRNA